MPILKTGMRRIRKKSERIFVAAYYSLIYGRKLPFADAMARWMEAWQIRRNSGDIPISQDEWEKQYRSGKWAGLARIDELARYSTIAGYLHQLRPNGSVLDVGGGEGVLWERFRPLGYSRYVSIDLASAANERLQGANDDRTQFITADASEYVPTEKFDAIVFNEVLYYLKPPLTDLFDRYAQSLSERGIFIVSTYLPSWRGRAILRQLRKHLTLIDETQITHGYKSWVCSVFVPKQHDLVPAGSRTEASASKRAVAAAMNMLGPV